MEIENDSNRLEFGAVSFTLSDESPFAVILGPSGSGKTTLMKSLFEPFHREWQQSGAFRVSENHRIDALSLDQLTRCIGYAAQRPYFLPYASARKNLVAPIKWTDKQEISEASIEQVIEHFQLSSFIDQKASFLSAGERQRLNLARAFLMSPRVVIIDECLSALDENMATEIRKTIQSQYASKCRILVISHRSSDLVELSKITVTLSDNRSQTANKRLQKITAVVS